VYSIEIIIEIEYDKIKKIERYIIKRLENIKVIIKYR